MYYIKQFWKFGRFLWNTRDLRKKTTPQHTPCATLIGHLPIYCVRYRSGNNIYQIAVQASNEESAYTQVTAHGRKIIDCTRVMESPDNLLRAYKEGR